jgi:hypothetical protein
MRVVCLLGPVALLVAGCTSLKYPWLSNYSPPTFHDQFRPDRCHDAYGPLLIPRVSSGCGTNVRTVEGMLQSKSFSFEGVDLPEDRVAAVLKAVQADVVWQARAAGVVMAGEVKVTQHDGVVRRFEFAYRHHGEEGVVFGEVRPSSRGVGWDLECVVAEKRQTVPAPDTGSRP